MPAVSVSLYLKSFQFDGNLRECSVPVGDAVADPKTVTKRLDVSFSRHVEGT